MPTIGGSIGKPDGGFYLGADFYYTQSIDGNSTTITSIASKVTKNRSTYKPYHLSGKSATLLIQYQDDAGNWITAANLSDSSGYDMRNVNTITLVSGSNIVIPHKSDGSQKIWIQLTVDGKLSNYYPYGTVSDYYELPTIPRATTPTLNPTTVVAGGEISISLPRASSNFTHKLYHSFYDTAWTEFATNVDTSAKLKIPISWASKMTDCAESWGEIKCETYSGSTYIGEKIVRFNVEVQDTIIPSVGTISITEAVDGLAAKFGAYIQNKSKLRVISTGTGIMGSTIVSYSVEVLGITYTGNDITTNLINQSGNVDVKVTVTDSRGRKGTKTVSVAITEYYSPTIVAFNAFRSDASGNEKNGSKTLRCVYNFKIAPCGNKNSKSYKIEYKKTKDSIWTTLTSGAVYSASSSFSKDNVVQLEYAYEVRLTVTDYFGAPATYVVKVGAEVVPIAVYPNGKGIGFGGYPTGEAFQVFMAAQFYKTLTLMDVDGNGTNIDLLNRLKDINTYISSEETKTNDYLLGKPIYTKTFRFATILSDTVIKISHGISNIDNVWVDLTNSFMQAISNGYSVPIISSMYYGKTGSGNNWSVAVDKTYVYLYADSGWNDNWVKFITIRYTKTID
mgnify:CR=1 FL=1